VEVSVVIGRGLADDACYYGVDQTLLRAVPCIPLDVVNDFANRERTLCNTLSEDAFNGVERFLASLNLAPMSLYLGTHLANSHLGQRRSPWFHFSERRDVRKNAIGLDCRCQIPRRRLARHDVSSRF